MVFTIACAVADSLGALVVFRFFAGIAASCSITIGPGSVVDMVGMERRGGGDDKLYYGAVGWTYCWASWWVFVSREAPCSNCVSRGVQCDLESPPEVSSEAVESRLLERIRKLEERVENQTFHQSQSVKHPEDFVTCAQQQYLTTVPNDAGHLDEDVAWLESIYADQDASVNLISPQC